MLSKDSPHQVPPIQVPPRTRKPQTPRRHRAVSKPLRELPPPIVVGNPTQGRLDRPRQVQPLRKGFGYRTLPPCRLIYRRGRGRRGGAVHARTTRAVPCRCGLRTSDERASAWLVPETCASAPYNLKKKKKKKQSIEPLHHLSTQKPAPLTHSPISQGTGEKKAGKPL
ncbi:hypothetical protein LY76DRAFT_163311 [Colletotrichum caudatum]|nr:hypothetical protein LY76DRAFT_163311 [Colletotrichum caudatum]